MKKLIAAGVTAILLIGALRNELGSPAFRRSSTRVTDVETAPTTVVEDTFEAAARGDVATYVSFWEGKLRTTLERERDLQGLEPYRVALRRQRDGLKGLVIEPAVITGHEAEVPVVCVYAMHSERQVYHLRKSNSAWRIVELGAITRFQPKIPYGTPTTPGP